ncbi:MAG: sugar ABC transporter substrate-binding protein [Acidimicrobiaceae bacterium]|nr:sugar ABC transporter substrate-binding protein [Acidimicrobiaceae bacterium]
MDFAVANAYDAAMLAATKAVATPAHVQIKVFDANNSSTTQYSQLQDVISSGQYQGIILQPIFGTALIPLVKQAIAKGIKVVNIDQILGPNLNTAQPQVPGLSGNASFIPQEDGVRAGHLVIQACQAHHFNPCQVGYMYDVKASALDGAERTGFDQTIASMPSIKVVAQGESNFTQSGGLKAAQDMLQAHPGINVFTGADQGIEGATQAAAAAGKSSVVLIGGGGGSIALANVKSKKWFGEVWSAPATEGKTGMQMLVKALQTGATSGGVDVIAGFPNNGEITQSNVGQYTAQYTG